MNKTKYTVYWMHKSLVSNALQFDNLSKAMGYLEELRKQIKNGAEFSAVTMCAEDINQVGKMGVDAIADGKTPDGVEYDWNKNDRIGKIKRSERIVKMPSTDNVRVNLNDE